MSEVKPGIYPRGTIDYDAIDAVRWSALKELTHSPRRFRHRQKNPKRATSRMTLGVASHTATLEPERFNLDYALFDGERRSGKAWESFAAINARKQIIKRDEYETAVAIGAAVRGDPIAGKYLASGQPEVTIVWLDEETGVLCKGRIDWLNPEPVIVDLKGTSSVESYSFCRSGTRLGIHQQLGFYHDGFCTLRSVAGVPVKAVAVEQTQPHDVAVYNMPPEVLEQGREDYRELLVKYQACKAQGDFPGYANGTEIDFQLPAWALSAEDELSELGLEM